MSVDMFAEEVDLSTLDSEAAAEVQSFATDVSSSFAASVSSSLGVSADTVAVSCLYRNSDVTKLDLLTLEGSCGSSRKLKALFLRERRLQAQGFGVEIEVLGDDAVQTATESDGEDNGQSATEMLAAQIASTPVVIESNLLPEGVTVGADLGDISVEVQCCFDRGCVCVLRGPVPLFGGTLLMTWDSNVCLCICVCRCVFFFSSMILFPYTRMYVLAFRGLAGACMYFVDPHSTRAARYIYSYEL